MFAWFKIYRECVICDHLEIISPFACLTVGQGAQTFTCYCPHLKMEFVQNMHQEVWWSEQWEVCGDAWPSANHRAAAIWAQVSRFECRCLLPGFVWGLPQISMVDCTSLSARLLPMMHLPFSSLARAVKEAIVPVTLRHVACTYDTEREKLFPLYLWNVFESIQREEVLLFRRFTECLSQKGGSVWSSTLDNNKKCLKKRTIERESAFFPSLFPGWNIFHL